MQTLIHTPRRAAGMFLRLALASGLLAASALPALAATASYVDASGNPQGPVTLTAPPLAGGGATTLGADGAASWYLCDAKLTYDGTITIMGDVNLILGEHCDMGMSAAADSNGAGINVTGSDNSLTVWAQSANAAGNGPSTQGSLTAQGDSAAGIGGNKHEDGGTVAIHGGTIHAVGGSWSAGIGGGGFMGNGGVTTIRGGAVHATGGNFGAGIGGGNYGDGGVTIIHGGTIHATGGMFGAGIGGGDWGVGGTITIDGGTVSATGGHSGAGIGGGAESSEYSGLCDGPIAITGSADVTATGGEGGADSGGGAGIGTGGTRTDAPMCGGAITIATTGMVQAYGGAPSSWAGGAGADVGAGGHASGDGAMKIPTHTITTSVTGNVGGSASPASIEHVAEGSSAPYTITPDAGYALDQVTVDGAPIAPLPMGQSHKLAVTDAHSAVVAIEVTFRQLPVTAATVTAVPTLHPALLALLAAALGFLTLAARRSFSPSPSGGGKNTQARRLARKPANPSISASAASAASNRAPLISRNK